MISRGAGNSALDGFWSRARWFEYSKAKDMMFGYTDINRQFWYVVDADDKVARLN